MEKGLFFQYKRVALHHWTIDIIGPQFVISKIWPMTSTEVSLWFFWQPFDNLFIVEKSAAWFWYFCVLFIVPSSLLSLISRCRHQRVPPLREVGDQSKPFILQRLQTPNGGSLQQGRRGVQEHAGRRPRPVLLLRERPDVWPLGRGRNTRHVA